MNKEKYSEMLRALFYLWKKNLSYMVVLFCRTELKIVKKQQEMSMAKMGIWCVNKITIIVIYILFRTSFRET